MAAQTQPLLQPTATISGQLLSPTLPEELIANILVRLPVRSLLQFKSVSKSWKTLISDPHFANTHLRFDTTITNQQLIFYSSKTEEEPYNILTYDLKPLFEENPSTCVKPVSFTSLNTNKYCLLDSCNGLLCLLDKSQRCLRLFNPSINFKSKRSPQVNPLHWCISYCGFGYDQIDDKYKFLAVLKNLDNFSETLTKIYTFGEDSCKTIQNFPYNYAVQFLGEFVSGTLNWLVRSNQSLTILSFDLNKETYREVLLPQNDVGEDGVVESWTKLMIIPHEKFRSNSLPAYHPWIVEPLFISENGVVLLRDIPASKFALYNLNTGGVVYPSLSRTLPKYLPVHRESLLSPQW
ncbi:hypothetical protein TSUD_28350 [Trifolium subterraneum]|uniref:F-box domain-containing protein n=1 Tax=Trifolium subterraneum TaxID=3900 RepID=A0A2Z6NGN7_TRISU|nr:hypothetical protein TSUD_28350 [Trifolium subterraneum]